MPEVDVATYQKEEGKDLKLSQYVTPKMQFGTLKLTKELKEAAFKALDDRYKSVKQQRDDKIQDYDRLDKLYRTQTMGDKNTLADIMTTDGFNSVEDWVAFIMDAMFPVDPPFDIKGMEEIFSEEQLDYIKKVLNKNRKKTDQEMEFERVSRQGVKQGTFVSKSSWQIDEEPCLYVVEKDWVVQVEVEDEQGQILFDEKGEPQLEDFVITGIDGKPIKKKEMSERIEIEDYASYKFVNLRNLFFRSDKLSWVIEKIDSTWPEIDSAANKDVPLYENLEAAKKTKLPSQQTDEDKEELETAGNEVEDVELVTELDKDVELLEGHHIPVTIKNKNGKKVRVLCIVTVANQKEVIRVQPTPYRKVPYLFNQFFEQAGVEGLGLLEILEKLLREINTRRTQALDANTMGLYGMKAVDMSLIKKPEQLKIRKDGLIELKPTNKSINQVIEFFRPPIEYANIAENLLDKVTESIIRTTRMKGILAGEKVTPQSSATEWQGMLQEALKSVKVILKRIARYQIEEWLERAYIMNVFNRQKPWKVPIEREVKVPGPENTVTVEIEKDFIEVTPEEIYSNGVAIESVGVAYMENTIVTRHQMMQKIDISVANAQTPMWNESGQMVTFDYYKIFKNFFGTFGTDDPADEFRAVPQQPGMGQGIIQGQAGQGGVAAPGIANTPPTDANVMQGAMGGVFPNG